MSVRATLRLRSVDSNQMCAESTACENSIDGAICEPDRIRRLPSDKTGGRPVYSGATISNSMRSTRGGISTRTSYHCLPGSSPPLIRNSNGSRTFTNVTSAILGINDASASIEERCSESFQTSTQICFGKRPFLSSI